MNGWRVGINACSDCHGGDHYVGHDNDTVDEMLAHIAKQDASATFGAAKTFFHYGDSPIFACPNCIGVQDA